MKVQCTVYRNGSGHMTMMAARPIYGESLLKASESGSPMILKLCMEHRWLNLYKVYMHGDPGLTYFTARSTLVAYVFKWGKQLKVI